METMRLDKALADQGEWSRKQVREQIAAGLVEVNGETRRDPACKINPATDRIRIQGKALAIERFCYLMLNKPAGVVSATRDPRQRTVLDLVPAALRRKGLFPAGRLDKDTTGLMILTDDGEFAHRILSPKKHVPKTYAVLLDRPVTVEMVDAFARGLQLYGEKRCQGAALTILEDCRAEVTIREGMYHQIKRMFASCGSTVLSLRRVSMGGLALDPSLPEGGCRPLSPEEVRLVEEAGQ